MGRPIKPSLRDTTEDPEILTTEQLISILDDFRGQLTLYGTGTPQHDAVKREAKRFLDSQLIANKQMELFLLGKNHENLEEIIQALGGRSNAQFLGNAGTNQNLDPSVKFEI